MRRAPALNSANAAPLSGQLPGLVSVLGMGRTAHPSDATLEAPDPGSCPWQGSNAAHLGLDGSWDLQP